MQQSASRHRPQGPARERRRNDFLGRVARATYPARKAILGALEGFPCNVLGHDMVEVPVSFRSAQARAAGRLEFRCSRCQSRAGFTN